jgi:hypothetical protein
MAHHVVSQLYGEPHGILQVFIIILYENVFQNMNKMTQNAYLRSQKE